MRTVTETFEDKNSVTVTRDAKGTFKFEIKVYGTDLGEVVRLARDTYRDLEIS